MYYLRVILLLVLALTNFGCSRGVDVSLNTPSGPIVGIETDGVRRFLGIPYAETTAGKNRWRPPVPKATWETAFRADEFGPWCPQFEYERRDEGETLGGVGWTIFLDVPLHKSSNEDCLSLNVWAPATSEPLQPVMVFLHGNALGSSYPAFDGSAFAKAGIVMVSINFRLHTMGNFAHPAITKEAGPNAPLVRYTEMDQLAALNWVQNNISAFGGNPNDVTLVGQSNGGAGILQMLGNKSVPGLFHKAIVQSGNGWWDPMGMVQSEKLGCMLAEQAGLNGCDATVEELRSVPWHTFPITGPYAIDDRNSQLGATEAIAAGKAIDIPLLIGWNDFDGSSLRYSGNQVVSNTHPDVLNTYPDDVRQDDDALTYAIYTDLHSGGPARWVAHQLENGAPTYLYLFSYVLSSQQGDVRGAEHAYELPHAFNSWNKVLPTLIGGFIVNDDDRKVTDIIHGCWVSFIKTGKPSCPNSPEWPRYQRAKDQLMQLDARTEVVTGYRAKQLDAHEQALEHYLGISRQSTEELLDQGIDAIRQPRRPAP